METRDILTMIGWPISCILSVLAGWWLIPRLTKKKKILLWAVVTESELISREIHQQLSLPVCILVGGAISKSLSLVTLRLGNAGNEVIEKIDPAVRFNPGASVLYIKPRGDLGEFQKCIEGKIETADKVHISFTHINPGFDCEFDFLLSDYEAGSLTVDLAAAGVTLIRRDPKGWVLSSSSFLRLGIGLFGVRYEPQVSILADIAGELKAMRKMMQNKDEKKG